MEEIFKRTFSSWAEFEKEFLIKWCDTYYQPISIRGSDKFSASDPLADKFKYQYVRYQCHHSGEVRQTIVDGSRPNQQTDCINCDEFVITVRYQKKKQVLAFTSNYKLKHNHDLNRIRYESYPFVRNRILADKENKELVTNLITAEAPVSTITNMLKEKYNCRITTKDIHNFGAKIGDKATQNPPEDSQIRKWSEKYSENKENTAIECMTSSQKYIKIKPVFDLLMARITQCDTDEFNKHYDFFGFMLQSITTKKHKSLYDAINDIRSTIKAETEVETETETTTSTKQSNQPKTIKDFNVKPVLKPVDSKQSIEDFAPFSKKRKNKHKVKIVKRRKLDEVIEEIEEASQEESDE